MHSCTLYGVDKIDCVSHSMCDSQLSINALGMRCPCRWPVCNDFVNLFAVRCIYGNHVGMFAGDMYYNDNDPNATEIMIGTMCVLAH